MSGEACRGTGMADEGQEGARRKGMEGRRADRKGGTEGRETKKGGRKEKGQEDRDRRQAGKAGIEEAGAVHRRE